MGITLLEENYQSLKEEIPTLIPYFSDCAQYAARIQTAMRYIFNHITPHLCTACENKCCEGFPLEGWFSLEDYALFRAKYPRPLPPHNRINHSTACSFATPNGCSLPEDLRPFTCVKINCSSVTGAIKDSGEEENLKRLVTALDAIHRDVSNTIKQHRESFVIARSRCKKAPLYLKTFKTLKGGYHDLFFL